MHAPLGSVDGERAFEPTSIRLETGSGSSSSPTAWSAARSRAAAPSASKGSSGRSLSAPAPTAAATAMAIQHAVTDCWKEPLQDDATLVVLAVD